MLINKSTYSLRQACAIIENPLVFLRRENYEKLYANLFAIKCSKDSDIEIGFDDDGVEVVLKQELYAQCRAVPKFDSLMISYKLKSRALSWQDFSFPEGFRIPTTTEQLFAAASLCDEHKFYSLPIDPLDLLISGEDLNEILKSHSSVFDPTHQATKNRTTHSPDQCEKKKDGRGKHYAKKRSPIFSAFFEILHNPPPEYEGTLLKNGMPIVAKIADAIDNHRSRFDGLQDKNGDPIPGTSEKNMQKYFSDFLKKIPLESSEDQQESNY